MNTVYGWEKRTQSLIGDRVETAVQTDANTGESRQRPQKCRIAETIKSCLTIFFFEKTGLYFTYNADSLHSKSYKDTFERKKKYIQLLARLSWLSSPPTFRIVTLKPTTLPRMEVLCHNANWAALTKTLRRPRS